MGILGIRTLEAKWWDFTFNLLKKDGSSTPEQYILIGQAQVPKFLAREDVRTFP